MLRMFFAGTTIRPRHWEYLKDATVLTPDHKNMLVRKKDNLISYYFPGSLNKLSLDQGTYSIENNFKRGAKILTDDINNALKEDSEKKLKVEIAGHSRGGVAAGRVVREISERFKDKKNIKINLITLDPVPGPFHMKKDTNLDFENQDANNHVVIYSLNVPDLHEPQKVTNPSTVIISDTNHNGVFGQRTGSEVGDTIDLYSYIYDSKEYPLSKLSELPKGVYLCKDECHLVRIDKSNIAECIEIINNKASESDRKKTLFDAVANRLGLRLDDVVDSSKDYRELFEKGLQKIDKAKTIYGAFNSALDLFASKSLFSVLVNREGIYESILEAKKCVTNLKNDPDKAIRCLKSAKVNGLIGKNGKLIIERLEGKLVKRYNLDTP